MLLLLLSALSVLLEDWYCGPAVKPIACEYGATCAAIRTSGARTFRASVSGISQNLGDGQRFIALGLDERAGFAPAIMHYLAFALLRT